ncbi:hypothetical protein [Streptomyces radicis]|uniref:hypothetical protein n=1 Tax=Streptomyces radicis TaxID=1750517 RepID=UPI001E48481E|nr:hypothetical protein [Streptomyces radicis]
MGSRVGQARVAAGTGMVLVLVSAALFVVVSAALADKRAYEGASACRGDVASDACTTTATGTVRDTEHDPHGRGVRHWLHLAEQGSVRMIGAEPVLNAVRPGDEVALTYWRGEIRRVGFGDAEQETWASPVDDWRRPLAFGLILLPLGLAALGLGRWRRHRWLVIAGVLTGAVVSSVGFVAGMEASDVPNALLVTAASAPPAAVLGAAYAWWWGRRMKAAADVSGIVAVPPEGKRCVRATVRGDVPYSVDGFDTLVVGDGRPAATPDPEGRVARRALPETLTVLRVRAFEPDDPEGWMRAYRHDGVVIECRDGDRPVLVATRRRDAPLVLGALKEAPMSTTSR